MVFYPPKCHPELREPPDDIPVSEFIFNEKYGRQSFSKSRHPYTCGLSGRTYSIEQMKQRSEDLSKGLLHEFGWSVNNGSQWEKTICVFTLNTIDVLTLNWAIHRIGGISSPANAGYTAFELEHQLKNSGSKAVFTCLPLLSVTLDAASKAGIPENRVFILDMPKEFLGDAKVPAGRKTVEQLIERGGKLSAPESLRWEKGQGSSQIAYLCYSSGTSGLPKGVMISHRNVIANILQFTTSEQPTRDKLGANHTDVQLCLLPMSHIYGLSLVCHSSTYRGDQLIVLPKFELASYLNAIATFKINILYIVPPIIINMIKNKPTCDRYDLSSVRVVFTGAAPLGRETSEDLQRQYPRFKIMQAYGASEASPGITGTNEHDILPGSSGTLFPGIEARLVSIEGNEITGYDQSGELLVKGPNVALGYLKNDAATKETFVEDGKGGRWLRTGDEVLIKKAPSGNEHYFIVDRIKELIKVKAFQVAPAELEAHLLTHLAVADCAVIPVPNEEAGEVPKAYVVKSQSVGLEENDRMIKRDIMKHVEKDKARYKWLKGGVEFVDVIPKNPSGKILRRLLREKDKESRRKASARL